MSVFIRRFTFDPGIEVFLEIEAVNVLDLEPPGSISGVGTGTAMLVGEFEDGPFASPTEVTSATDLSKNFGGFGYTAAGITGNNPCARKRFADGAITPEFWNGNGIIALNGKKFRRLLLTRVDTSVGGEQFNRLAWLRNHSASFSYALTPLGTFIYGHGTSSFTTTFTAVAALIASGVGVYPTLFVGGETMTIKHEGVQVVVVFQATDQTQAQVIARINSALGYTAASDAGGGVTNLVGSVLGTDGSIQVVALGVTVAAATGFAAGAPVFGTGNVGNILLVKPSEIDAAVNLTSAGAIRVVQLNDGSLRLENRATPLVGMIRITGGTVLGNLGWAVGQNAAWQDVPQAAVITQVDAAVTAAIGFSLTAPGLTPAVTLSAAGVYPTLFVGGEKMTIQVGNSAAKVVTFQAADQTQAQVTARIDKVLGYNATEAQSATITALAGTGTNNTTIPAGTILRNAGGDAWVTMQTTQVAASNAGPYDLRVRPAIDDGTGVAAALATVTILVPVQSAAWSVINPLAFSAALTEAAIDAKYLEALTSTLNPSTVAAITNLIWCARQSNAIRTALRDNAVDASASGLYGRMAAIRPPLGTSRAAAKSSAAMPGVGAYRSQRVIYCYPGVQTFVPVIASKGTGGGEGFTADGVIDTGADGFMISVCSQLPPEENPGQLTTFAAGALGVEKNNPDVQVLTINDYIAFRGAGIAAPRVDGGVMIFQSGVTSIDPLVQPGLRNVARRRMADFIQDSLALAMKAFGKKLNTRTRRALIAGQIKSFMTALLSPGNSAAQRIDGYKLDPVTGNTPDTLALGIFRIILNVRTLSSLDAIVLQTTIGESVDVSEAA